MSRSDLTSVTLGEPMPGVYSVACVLFGIAMIVTAVGCSLRRTKPHEATPLAA